MAFNQKKYEENINILKNCNNFDFNLIQHSCFIIRNELHNRLWFKVRGEC